MEYLLSTVPKRLQCLRGQRPGNPTLFRVPEEKRETCKLLYVPKSIVLGPYHKEQETEEMRKLKLFFLKDFLSRSSGNAAYDAYWSKTKDLEPRVANFYSGVPITDRVQFLEMLLMDGIFILEVMLMCREGRLHWELCDYLRRTYRVDFLLAENQLPFCVLTEVYNILCDSNRQEMGWLYPSNVSSLAMEFFDLNPPPESQQDFSHLLHLFYVAYVMPSTPASRTPAVLSLDSQRIQTIPSATDLKDAGVRFVSSSDDMFFLLKFEHGTLQVPRIVLDYATKCLLANLVAFEEMADLDKPVTSWSRILKLLIRNEQDLFVFLRHRIIGNVCGTSSDIIQFFNNLNLFSSLNANNDHLTDLYERLNLYYDSKLHRWRTAFKRAYLRWPWSGLTTFWAVFASLLALSQFYWRLKSEVNK